MTTAVLIFSTSRSGSTTLCRALNLFPGVRIANEPPLDDVQFTAAAVRERVAEVLSEYTGFKHVFDPSGFPFCNIDYGAPIAEMKCHGRLWLELNATILNIPGLRVVFLRRRNGFDRVMSELMGRVTKVWGYDEKVSPDEANRY